MLETLTNLALICLGLLMVAWFFSAPKTVLFVTSLLVGAYLGTASEHSLMGTLVGSVGGGVAGLAAAGVWALLAEALGWGSQLLARFSKRVRNHALGRVVVDRTATLVDRVGKLDPGWVYFFVVGSVLLAMLLYFTAMNLGWLPSWFPLVR